VEKQDIAYMYYPVLAQQEFIDDFVGRILENLFVNFSGSTRAGIEAVTVRRLVTERRQEKEARFPQYPVGLADQGSQVGPALLDEVATPSDQATDMYGIDGNFIASHAAIALFHPPTNCPFASIIGPI